ncbi:MAG: hypothetical protein IPP48_15900 [Chitinophagaceae bacterium]|nr:hypothetical protein [Chitinophagaceae bacterium]
MGKVSVWKLQPEAVLLAAEVKFVFVAEGLNASNDPLIVIDGIPVESKMELLIQQLFKHYKS